MLLLRFQQNEMRPNWGAVGTALWSHWAISHHFPSKKFDCKKQMFSQPTWSRCLNAAAVFMGGKRVWGNTVEAVWVSMAVHGQDVSFFGIFLLRSSQNFPPTERTWQINLKWDLLFFHTKVPWLQTETVSTIFLFFSKRHLVKQYIFKSKSNNYFCKSVTLSYV